LDLGPPVFPSLLACTYCILDPPVRIRTEDRWDMESAVDRIASDLLLRSRRAWPPPRQPIFSPRTLPDKACILSSKYCAFFENAPLLTLEHFLIRPTFRVQQIVLPWKMQCRAVV
jgi:hypothetical protein